MKFEQTGMNNAGYPILERVQKKPKKVNRRGFLKTLGGGAIVAGGLGVGSKLFEKDDVVLEEVSVTPSDPQETQIEEEEKVEHREALPDNEAYEAQKEGFKQWWTLSFNEVQFLSQDGSPFGEPVALDDVLVEDPVRPGQMQRISVGKKNEAGIIVGGIAGAWLAYHRDRLGLDIAKGEGTVLHITKDFEQALQNNSEPELVASIKDAVAGGNGIDSMVDIVRYFGMNVEKKVRGDIQERTRAAYLQEEITFHDQIPKTVQDELRRLIIGLAAQESRFNAGIPKNSATAEGILQLTDAVRKEHGFDPDDKLSFIQEVAVAGKHFSNIYTRVKYWMKNERIEKDTGTAETVSRLETHQILRSLFPEGSEGEVSWQKYFLTPCMINAYNAGSRTIGACLHEFVKSHTKEELQEMAGENPGYNLFTKFTYFAQESSTSSVVRNYGQDAGTYFVSIAAAAEVV